MDFNVNSVIDVINRTNTYLLNACSVQSSEASNATRNLLKAKEEQKVAEKRIDDECKRKVDAYAKKAKELIDADADFVKQLKELNEKLKSVDKKYAKCESRISFAGITDESKKQLLLLINGSDDFDEKMVEKIYLFFKNNSYRYISKPVSPIIIASKKRKRLYEQLASCLLVVDSFVEENKKYYIDRRDEDVKAAKEDAAQQVFNLRKRFDIKLNAMLQESQADNTFLLEESQKTLFATFDEAFYVSYKSIRDKAKQCFTEINEEDAFNDEIYVGDIAWGLEDSVINNPIGEKFIKNNSQLFEDGVAFLPWTMKLSNCQSVFLTPATSADKEAAISWVNQFLYSFIRQLPVNGVELTIFDPDRRGNSIFPFLNLPSLMPEMFSKKIFTSTEDITSRVQELNQYVDSVIQQKLSNKYKDVFEYNAATPENPLPIKVVCVFDFPKFFENRAYENLLSIIKNASRCGIFVAICYNPSEQKNSYGDIVSTIQSIKEESICLIQSNGLLRLEKSGFAVLPIELPKQTVIDEFCISYERTSKKKLAKGIPFISVVKDGDFFTKKSAECISLPVGKGDGSATQFIEFGKRSSQHAIITGATGSGKSTLLHTLIMSALINYSPDELNLYLMDFKSGTEFKVYETVPVPHIKLLALDALQEFGESILMELVEEQNRRSQLFKDSGEHTNLKSYVSATGQSMPRILVIMDEFQILFNESANRKVAMHCAELANKIVTEGRAFGIHLVMATQTLRSIREKTALSNSTIEQMRIRVGLKCGEEDANYIFGDVNARDALMKMKGAIGTAVYNPEFTEARNSGFRVAYCAENEQKSLLAAIATVCKDKFTANIKVFEGKRVPQFPVSLIDTYKQNDTSEIALEIGEPIRIDTPVKILFNKKKNNNLLVVGSDTNLMSQIISNIVLGASFTPNTNTYFMDGNAFFDEPIDPYVEHLSNIQTSIKTITTRKDCLLCIEELYDEFKKRRKSISNSNEKHIVVINGLQYIDILSMILKGDYINREDYIETDFSAPPKVDDGGLDFSFDDAPETIEYSSALKELVELGYAYGIYFVIACNEYQTVREVLHYGASLMNKLTNRIVFAISDKDSDELIDGIQVSGMNSVTAVYTDGIKRTMQFKPYSTPQVSDIQR